MWRVFAIVFMLAGLAGSYYAVRWVLWQHEACVGFQGVACTILWSQVEEVGSEDPTYRPEIDYWYVYQGRTYRGTRVFPESGNGKRTWAEEVAGRYRPGSKTVAYVNPAKPEEAILIREYSSAPYLVAMVVIGVTGVAGGWAMGLFKGNRGTPRAVSLGQGEAVLLLPQEQIHTQLRGMATLLGVTALSVLPLAVHWVVVARQPVGWPMGLILGGSSLVLMLCAMGTVNRWRLSRRVSDARVKILSVPIKRGEPVRLDVEVDALANIRVKRSRVKAVCMEHYLEKRGGETETRSRKHREIVAALTESVDVSAGQMLSGTAELVVPTLMSPSTHRGVKGYPRYTWQLEVEVDMGGTPYRAVYPVEVV